MLVTGGAGYLGSVLLPKLLTRGHQVRVLDIGYFGLGHLSGLRNRIELVRDDLRRVLSDQAFAAELVDGCDAVIHLAAISNDPSAELNPELTSEINYSATIGLAHAARDVRARFLFSSSCSVYGENDGECHEESAVAPLTVYAVSKVRSEQDLAGMVTNEWRPVILRNGTLFGYSPRMRFDLVVNIFSLYGAIRNEIHVFGEGRQWRPFLHVADCARAFVYLMERSDLSHSIYNVAHENRTVADLAEMFGRLRPSLSVNFVATENEDKRDYRASTERLAGEGFITRSDCEAGAEEMMEAIVSGVISDPESIFYRNAKWLKELTRVSSMRHLEVVQLMEIMGGSRPNR